VNQYVLAIALVFGRHQPNTALLQQSTNDGLLRALQNLDHAALGSTFAIEAHNARFDTVSVQDSTHLVGRQINVWCTVITLHKTMTISVTRHGSFKLFQ
jgi:hypothetical protein